MEALASAEAPQAPLAREPLRAWGNVPARNPAFAGREEQLARIRQALAGEGGRAAVQALHGMGGVGKTQLAIEYAHRHSGDYDVTWWLDSENTALMTQQYADLAEHLGAARKGLPVDAVRRALLSDLHRRPRWLLVFDNAEDPAFLRDWLPSGPGHVIITSRSQDWAELAAPIPVEVLPRPESVELLRARVPGITTGDAETLAGALGDLPLALAQAAAFLAGTRMPAAGYTQLLKDRAAALLSKGKPLTYRDTLSAATALACDRLRASDKDAASLAEICAFLAPEPVPVGWLVTAAGKLPGGLPARLPDPLERDDLVAALTRTSLARLNDDGLTMHRLTQAILRARSTEPVRSARTPRRSSPPMPRKAPWRQAPGQPGAACSPTSSPSRPSAATTPACKRQRCRRPCTSWTPARSQTPSASLREFTGCGATASALMTARRSGSRTRLSAPTGYLAISTRHASSARTSSAEAAASTATTTPTLSTSPTTSPSSFTCSATTTPRANSTSTPCGTSAKSGATTTPRPWLPPSTSPRTFTRSATTTPRAKSTKTPCSAAAAR